MGRSGTPRSLVGLVVVACLMASLAAGLVACSSHDAAPEPSSSTPLRETAVAGATDAAVAPAYRTRNFAPALTVAPPSWLPPEPAADERHFLTWVGEGVDVDRAVRFLSPVGLYDPGHRPGRLGPLPRDYLAYLRGLARYGAVISAATSLDVDGHPATVVTASTQTGLDGALGCRSLGPPATECFGLQEFAVLRLAVIVIDGGVVLAWARVVPGSPYADHDFGEFEHMLEGLRFR